MLLKKKKFTNEVFITYKMYYTCLCIHVLLRNIVNVTQMGPKHIFI